MYFLFSDMVFIYITCNKILRFTAVPDSLDGGLINWTVINGEGKTNLSIEYCCMCILIRYAKKDASKLNI